MATRPSASAFSRLIRSGTSMLTEIYAEVDKVDPLSATAKTEFLSLQATLDIKFSDIKSRLQPYYVLDDLPENLTEEALEAGLASVEKLHSKLYRSIQFNITNLSNTVTSVERPREPSLVSLPKFDINKFSGKFQDWPNFYARFESLVHNHKSLTNSQKLQFLISLLDSAPLQLINHLSISDSSYPVALECLKERYYNPRRLIVYHCDQLLNLPNFDGKSAASMRSFLDQYSINYKALCAIPDINVLETIFTTLLMGKLDTITKVKFEFVNQSTSFPTLDELIKFLKSQVVQKENTALTSDVPELVKRKGRVVPSLVTSASLKCVLCSSDHRLHSCKKFISMSPHDRFSFIRQQKYCVNCLGTHQSSKCGSKYVCRTCSKKHHSLLHFDTTSPSVTTTAITTRPIATENPLPNNSATDLPQSLATSVKTNSSSVLMATCLVRLQTSPNNYIVARGVLDSASHASFVTERCAQLLRAHRGRSSLTISGIGQTLASSSGTCQLSITTLTGQMVSQNHPFIIMSKISLNTPVMPISPQVYEAAKAYTLADPTFSVPSAIDVLLSAEITVAVIQGAPLSLGISLPYVMPTLFGYVLMGECPVKAPSCNLACVDSLMPQPVDPVLSSLLHGDYHSSQPSTVSSLITSTHDDLMSSLQRFWEIEEPPFKQVSEEDTFCEQLYSQTTTRTAEGRYVVRLPFKESSTALGDSYSTAVKRLYSLERKFKANPDFQTQYIQFMNEYEAQGHMKPIASEKPLFFIPHHGIYKSHGDSGKLRVVFDASCKTTTGLSLNDILYSGQKLQTLITDVITLFRKFKYTFVSDIVKMFRQIKVHESDQPYQCILWRAASHLPIQQYLLTTVTYGVSSSPYLALRTLTQLALDEGQDHPNAAIILKHCVFVDDIIGGADSLSAALALRNELISLLAKGGFSLSKWSSNHLDLLSGISKDSLQKPLTSTEPIHILGLLWDSTDDTFMFDSFSDLRLPSIESKVTKRIILAQIASLYDPCGWLSPVILKAKAFLQHLWLLPLDWDSPLPDSLTQQWHSFLQSLPSLSLISIPRAFSQCATEFQLHGFSDASMSGYGAVLYLRTVQDQPHVTLLASKTRVTPLKSQTLPRLELLGAHLLAKLSHHYMSVLHGHINIQSVHLWSDSTIVLQWLKIPPIKLKTFVANRVSQILEWTLPEMWSHVPSPDNPADLASRGIIPCQLSSQSLWWNGPAWLIQAPSQWPKLSHDKSSVTESEIIQPVLLSSTVHTPDNDVFSHLSSWLRIVRVVSLILLWVNKVKTVTDSSWVKLYDHAFICICRYIQFTTLDAIFKSLTKGDVLPKTYQRLGLFIDTDGLIRVGGRVQLPQVKNQPILLPKNHRLVDLLIDYYHQAFAHSGSSFVQAQLSKRVWLLSARQQIRSRVLKCVRCHRANPTDKPPQMANLPLARIVPSPPFYHTGMDFAGPFQTKLHHLRKSPVVKTYLCVFICFSTKAIHLEVAHDLSVLAFLDVLRRFISRRSAPAHLYSDNGTNFVGTSAKLHRDWQQFLKDNSENILHFTASQCIKFHFSPPASPHFGGLWERAVKSAKFHITRVLGNHVPTLSQLYSLYARIEAILNSRPLTAISSDPADLEVLTPAHFLVGRPMVSPPTVDAYDSSDLLTKFNLVQCLTQQFWQRWRLEYLPTLQPRSKWNKSSSNLKVGDVVVMEEPNTPPLSWPLGRILEVFPSTDNIVRKVRVHTCKGDYIRSAVRLFRLPFQHS